MLLLNTFKRSRTLHRVLGIGYEFTIKPTYRSYTLHEIRINLYSNRLCLANGFGFQSLSIAGTNTLLQHINNNQLNNYVHKRQVSYVHPPRKTGPHKPRWNKTFVHGIEYDTEKKLKDAEIFKTDSLINSTDPNVYNLKKNKIETKKFNFEYLEYLKQKYRKDGPQSKRNKKSNSLFNTSKREFASDVSQPEPGAPQFHAARVAAHQQQIMAREDEINPTSLGGMMVILIGAAIFYWLYNIDNTKHSGISSFLSAFSKTKSLEDFLNKQETKPIHKIADDWKAWKVIMDHIKNMCLCWFDKTKYNSEYIWSKLFRLFYIPSARLLPPTRQNVYTLIVDLDTVCHSTWSRKEGFERTMRPYYKEFISRMFASGWEVVIFGQCEDYDWMESPDIVKLDGKGYVHGYLWNKDCYYFNGHRCKDLSRLGRDLKHVIAIDSDARSIQMQPENALILSKWKPPNEKKSDVPKDTSLLQLIEFLEYLAKAEVHDVRQVLAAYRGKDIAQEFRKRYFAAVHAQLQQPQYAEEDEAEENEDEGELSVEEQENPQYAV